MRRASAVIGIITIVTAAGLAGVKLVPVTVDAHAASTSRWFSHVQALANDGMEGRETGSPAHKRAAEYVAAEFQKAGLQPAGAVGFIEPVRFKTRRVVEAQSSLALVRDSGAEPLKLGDDAYFNMRVDPAPSVEAPLVFAGYGLKVPEYDCDDLSGIDVKDKVVVYISGGPSSIPAALRSHYQSASERWTSLREAGALGTVSIANPASMDVPWERATLARLRPQMVLADASLDETRSQKLSVTMNPAHADKLLDGSGHTFGELIALADAGKPLPRFPLPARIRAVVHTDTSDVESQNVLGTLPGRDVQRRSEYVVLSAHLDHVGIGAPIKGDRIYNGAMDNASGVAALIEVASQLHESNAAPKRSLLFAAVTAEEKGLLGSRYFVAHPPVPKANIVADVNTDMFLPLFPLKMLMVLGLDESDLGQDVRAVAEEASLAVQADPEPHRNRFTRSDQYSFIRGGIPAVSMKVGYDLDTPEARIAQRWTAERYHAPSDDLNQPIDLTAAEAYVQVVRKLALRIADRENRPAWNPASFFKRFTDGAPQ
jgi:hypothetical protein